MRDQLSANPGPSELVDLSGVRARRDAVVREIERTERQLAEATAALTLPVARLTTSA